MCLTSLEKPRWSHYSPCVVTREPLKTYLLHHELFLPFKRPLISTHLRREGESRGRGRYFQPALLDYSQEMKQMLSRTQRSRAFETGTLLLFLVQLHVALTSENSHFNLVSLSHGEVECWPEALRRQSSHRRRRLEIAPGWRWKGHTRV